MRGHMGLGFHFGHRGKPKELTIEAEVKRQNAAIKFKEKVFAVARDAQNLPILRKPDEIGGLLRLVTIGCKTCTQRILFPRISVRRARVTASTSGSSGMTDNSAHEPGLSVSVWRFVAAAAASVKGCTMGFASNQ